MRPARALAVYVVVVFVGGALLAPWVHALAQFAALHFPALQSLADQPFRRYVHRVMLVLALVAIWPVFRISGLSTLRDAGIVPLRGHRRELVRGFLAGFGTLAIAAAITLAFGARTVNASLHPLMLPAVCLVSALSATVVSIIEEVFFRGALFGMFRQSLGVRVGMLASAAIYALVHFFERPEPPVVVDWSTGLFVLAGMLRGFANPDLLVPGFFTLLAAGALLALVYQRTGNLYASIGLHAGWIFWLKNYNFLTLASPDATSRFWGTGKLYDGWLAFAVIAGALWFCYHRWPPPQTGHPDNQA